MPFYIRTYRTSFVCYNYTLFLVILFSFLFSSVLRAQNPNTQPLHNNVVVPEKIKPLEREKIGEIKEESTNTKSDKAAPDLKYLVTPFKDDCIYEDTDEAGFAVELKNMHRNDAQNGTLDVLLQNNEDGKKLINLSYELHMKGNQTVVTKISFGKGKLPTGFYKVTLAINLDFYEDTLVYMIGINPDKIYIPTKKPKDYDAFWAQARNELEQVNPNYVVTEIPELTTKHMKTYLVEFKSLGNVTVRGWLTVPREKKKYPVIYLMPGYRIEMQPDIAVRRDFAVFRLNVRGVGNSADNIKIPDDKYMLYNINSKFRYIYRGAYMDCVRGLDFLYTHPELGINPNKIALDGGSQGATLALVVAAFDERAKSCMVEFPLFSNLRSEFQHLAWQPKIEFPLKDFIQYTNDARNKLSKEDLLNVWDYFEVQNLVQKIKCPLLMGVALRDRYVPPQSIFSVYNQIGSTIKEIKVNPYKDHEMDFAYFMFQDLWVREQLRVP
jgi:cephalosporin-C deacetylase